MSEDEADGSGRIGRSLACNLSAFDETQRRRRALLGERLQVGMVDINELPDGYAFHLDAVSLAAQHVDEFIALEKRCCPFLRIDLRRGHGGPVLEVGGGKDVKAFIAAQFGVRRDMDKAVNNSMRLRGLRAAGDAGRPRDD